VNSISLSVVLLDMFGDVTRVVPKKAVPVPVAEPGTTPPIQLEPALKSVPVVVGDHVALWDQTSLGALSKAITAIAKRAARPAPRGSRRGNQFEQSLAGSFNGSAEAGARFLRVAL
jgi:hypothetical protein